MDQNGTKIGTARQGLSLRDHPEKLGAALVIVVAVVLAVTELAIPRLGRFWGDHPLTAALLAAVIVVLWATWFLEATIAAREFDREWRLSHEGYVVLRERLSEIIGAFRLLANGDPRISDGGRRSIMSVVASTG